MTIRDTINDDVTIVSGERTMLAGRYRIVRQLGQGGMGSVWLAEDSQLDNKLFAIKMLPSILVSNKRAYRQLKDEALVAMKLTHPNIVTLRAFEEDNGNPFLVMDYVEGQTLDDYLAEEGKLSEEEAVSLLRPIAAALDYAHSKNVVHRDVKPGNIMISKEGTPFILDFGIAREMQETLTRVTGKLSSGTLLYMSPEQLNGESPKSAQDVYSFAAMVYECLKGHPPFHRGQIEYQILNNRPDILSGFACASAVMTGLAKNPEQRPTTCMAVLGGGSAPKTIERKSSTGMVLAFLVIIAVLGGGVWYHIQQQEKLQEHARILAAQKAEAESRAEEQCLSEEKRISEEHLKSETAEREAEKSEPVLPIHSRVENQRRILEEISKQLMDFCAENNVDTLRSNRNVLQQGLQKTTEDVLALETEEAQLAEWEKFLVAIQQKPEVYDNLSAGVPRAREIESEYRAYKTAYDELQNLLVVYTYMHPEVIDKKSEMTFAKQKFIDAAQRALLVSRSSLQIVRIQLSNLKSKQENLRNDISSIDQKIVYVESEIRRLNAEFDVANQVLAGLVLEEKKSGGVSDVQKTTSNAYDGPTKEYIVKAGDSLGSIAYGNGINIKQFKQLNGLTSNTLHIGQRVKVPDVKQSKIK